MKKQTLTSSSPVSRVYHRLNPSANFDAKINRLLVAVGALAVMFAPVQQAPAQSSPTGCALFSRPTDTISINGHTHVTNQITIEAEILIPSSLPAPTYGSPRIFEEQLSTQGDKQFYASPSAVGGSTWVVDNENTEIVVANPGASDVWHHLAFIHDFNEDRVYMDGVQIGTNDFSGDPSIACSPESVMSIGYFLYTDGGYVAPSFIGAIRWLRVSCVARYTGNLITPPVNVPAPDAFTQVLFDFRNLPTGTSTVYDLSPNRFVGTVAVGFSGATSPNFVPLPQYVTNGLVAYYPFNGNASDATGNGNDGTVCGATLTQDRFGVSNSAYSFDGVTDYIAIPDFPQADTSSHTISFWVSANSWTNIPTPSQLYVDILGKDGSPRQWVFQGKRTGQIRCTVFTSSGENILDSIAQLQTNQWYHVAAVWDGTNESAFINGVFDSSIPAPGTLIQGSNPVRIGGDPIGDQQFLDGKIDDVRIYNRALSSNEIAELYVYESTNGPSFTATAAPDVTNGFVVGATLSDGGNGYTNTPSVRIIGGGGNGAQAEAVVSNGVVIAIDILDAGSGYTNTPIVVIDPPFIANPVLDGSPMSFLTFSNLTLGGVYQLQEAAAWYWTNQPVSFTATNSAYAQMVSGVVNSGDFRLALNPVPAQAFAVGEVVNGFVVGTTLTSGGSGYVTSPPVTIIGGGGTNAAAVSQISGGVVTNISITSAGIGYTNTPTVEIGQPPCRCRVTHGASHDAVGFRQSGSV
ncbi:MAG: LamG-like jellyroll fold domain-containing protein [Verrucomicrobiota bacterium]